MTPENAFGLLVALAIITGALLVGGAIADRIDRRSPLVQAPRSRRAQAVKVTQYLASRGSGITCPKCRTTSYGLSRACPECGAIT